MPGAGGLPIGVSSDGKVIGVIGGTQNMYFWPTPSSTPTLVSLPGFTLTPMAVNSSGIYVGYAYDGPSAFAMVGSLGSGPVDLSTLLDSSGAGWTLYRAQAINDDGWIAGDGLDPSGKSAGFLAVPI
jgi:hypothetical protein